ncbi:MAG TPA: hypothetical protein PK006_02440 [Saprospiraceae bacterium]|nr:hypothetical protein [Saprospiraceae bacterium]
MINLWIIIIVVIQPIFAQEPIIIKPIKKLDSLKGNIQLDSPFYVTRLDLKLSNEELVIIQEIKELDDKLILIGQNHYFITDLTFTLGPYQHNGNVEILNSLIYSISNGKLIRRRIDGTTQIIKHLDHMEIGNRHCGPRSNTVETVLAPQILGTWKDCLVFSNFNCDNLGLFGKKCFGQEVCIYNPISGKTNRIYDKEGTSYDFNKRRVVFDNNYIYLVAKSICGGYQFIILDEEKTIHQHFVSSFEIDEVIKFNNKFFYASNGKLIVQNDFLQFLPRNELNYEISIKSNIDEWKKFRIFYALSDKLYFIKRNARKIELCYFNNTNLNITCNSIDARVPFDNGEEFRLVNSNLAIPSSIIPISSGIINLNSEFKCYSFNGKRPYSILNTNKGIIGLENNSEGNFLKKYVSEYGEAIFNFSPNMDREQLSNGILFRYKGHLFAIIQRLHLRSRNNEHTGIIYNLDYLNN